MKPVSTNLPLILHFSEAPTDADIHHLAYLQWPDMRIDRQFTLSSGVTVSVFTPPRIPNQKAIKKAVTRQATFARREQRSPRMQGKGLWVDLHTLARLTGVECNKARRSLYRVPAALIRHTHTQGAYKTEVEIGAFYYMYPKKGQGDLEALIDATTLTTRRTPNPVLVQYQDKPPCPNHPLYLKATRPHTKPALSNVQVITGHTSTTPSPQAD